MPLPGRERFAEALQHVRRTCAASPARTARCSARPAATPRAMTLSLVALGTVLLDIAAGAFRLTPDEMLDKVSARVAEDGEA